MGILSALPAALLCACFSPNADLCSHVCSNNSDCVSDQVCTNQHLCGNTVASCGDMTLDSAVPKVPQDAHNSSPDAAPPPPPDAGPFIINLHVHVDGNGGVTAVLFGTCDSEHALDCVFTAPAGVLVTLVATPHSDARFDRWTSSACAGQPAICTITPAQDVQVVAKFRDGH
jgi:hypothetical protein